MIAILDNGGEYSMHKIVFVELPDELPRPVLETLAAWFSIYSYEGKVLATAASFSWWHGKVYPLSDFLDDVECGLADRDNRPTIPAELEAAAREWITQLRALQLPAGEPKKGTKL